MSSNTDTELLTELLRSIDDMKRQGADNQAKLDRVLLLLDGDDAQSIGMRAEMRELKRVVSNYGDHEERIKTLEGESTTQKGYTVGRKTLITGFVTAVTLLGAILYFANQLSVLGEKIVRGGG